MPIVRYLDAQRRGSWLSRAVNTEDRIALVAGTWTPTQQMHPGNVAWHGSGCDGASPPDTTIEGPGWFADVWREGVAADVDGHFSPYLGVGSRAAAFDQIREAAPVARISLVAGSAMARTVRDAGAEEAVSAPYFLLQHRDLADMAVATPPPGYSIVRAEEAGEQVRVDAHRRAWAPARIKQLLGLEVSGQEPGSTFSVAKYRALQSVSIYRPELDLVVLADCGTPAAFALGWLDGTSGSVLFEPVGTSPEHAREGLARAACQAVMTAARDLGATQAVVGPRGDDAYPAPRLLYASMGFRTVGRTELLTWS